MRGPGVQKGRGDPVERTPQASAGVGVGDPARDALTWEYRWMLDQIELPPACEPQGGEGVRRRRLRERITAAELAVAVAFAVPIIVWAWRVVGFGNRFQYSGDNANNELSSLDVLSHVVTLG